MKRAGTGWPSQGKLKLIPSFQRSVEAAFRKELRVHGGITKNGRPRKGSNTTKGIDWERIG